MFIHIGDREIVSDRQCVGIFNTGTLRMSQENRMLCNKIAKEAKTAAVMINGNVVSSRVSPFTVITRMKIKGNKDIIWSKNNVKELQR